MADSSRPRRTRLADVARAAGTSPPIASRILNRDPSLSVSAELRARVVQVAKELGYRPHAGARSLRLAGTGALGLLLPSFLNPVYTYIVRGAFQRAAERDYTVLLAEDVGEKQADETFARLVAAGRIDGLLVASAYPGHPLTTMLAERGVPHVFMNRGVPGSGRNVVLDEERAAAVAVDHLASLGHRRLAHVAGPAEIEPAARRAEGFRARVAELGLDEPIVVEADFLETGGSQGMTRILERDGRVTAVYTSTASQAAGALNAAWRRGIVVPGDVSLVASGDMPLADALVPPVTTVRMPFAELGAVAVDALIDQIEGADPVDVTITSAPEVVVRESAAAPRLTPSDDPRRVAR
ncbi:MAG: LacI family DNA-binding transcriptional regulator [Thermoleophilia bacterium]